MLSKKNKEALFNPLSKDNPVLVQILGICSALAVTASLEPAIVMGISVICVLAQDHSHQHPHHRAAGGGRRAGYHCATDPHRL